ncbi:MAG: hypothetical protein H6509_04115 [Bryobacterales bacterium]|nr:hypothetical protein [Bryobacterales bacterium]
MRLIWIALLCASWMRAETDPKALEWLYKAQEQAGGADAIAAIRDVRQKRQMRSLVAGVTAEQTLTYIVPKAFKQESALPFGKVIVFVDADGGWMNGPQGQLDLPPPQRKQADGELFRIREALLLADRLDDREVRFVREADDDGRPAVVLEVAAKQGGETAQVWIDKESGEFYKLAYAGIVLAGQPPLVEERFSDFRELDGVRLPYKTAIHQNGPLLTDVTVLELELNSGVTVEELARKPEPAATPAP